MEEIMLKISHISKQYRLGQIGGTTLREEIQRWNAKRKHEEDPTRKIGEKDYEIGETFMALDDVSMEVQKGERVGIIGHNGAGKSTLLKLISRITAPTSGDIWMNGRVASMLEVGTGFHGELTGRENIYMNGAILGMKKKEIDAKIEDIIEFSECRKFIDTPVKRYSSGMYVKLAFSVAAHLDAEIMIMDEVLAVGDTAFQKKCLDKMRDVSKTLSRTILYVSHNMNTIRQLCDRVVVLNHGKVVFNGDVEKGIECYLGESSSLKVKYDLSKPREGYELDNWVTFRSVSFPDKASPIFYEDEPICMMIDFVGAKPFEDLAIRIVLTSRSGVPAGMATSQSIITVVEGAQSICLKMSHEALAPGSYCAKLVAYSADDYGKGSLHDVVENAFSFETVGSGLKSNHLNWNSTVWGYTRLPTIDVKRVEDETC